LKNRANIGERTVMERKSRCMQSEY